MPLVPVVVKQSPQGERSYDIFSRLLSERIIMLGTPVNDDIANLIVAQIMHLANEDPETDISLYINSPGGSVHAGLAIYDAMQYVKNDVQTICYGIAMSMGAVLLAGGTAGKRMATPNSRIMIHQVSGGYQGQASDILIQAKETMYTGDKLYQILADHTGQDKETIREDSNRDKFFDPNEAKEYGLIDKVVMPHEISNPSNPAASNIR